MSRVPAITLVIGVVLMLVGSYFFLINLQEFLSVGIWEIILGGIIFERAYPNLATYFLLPLAAVIMGTVLTVASLKYMGN